MAMLELRADQRQTQTLSPRLQRAVRLLQMSSLDFAAMVRDTLGQNPFLEADDGDGAADGGGHDPLSSTSLLERLAPESMAGDGSAAGSSSSTEANESLAELDRLSRDDAGSDPDFERYASGMDEGSDGSDGGLAANDSDRDLWQADGPGGTRSGEGGEGSALDLMTQEASLAEHLHQQINVLPLGARDLMLARTVVESLDDDGYLRTPLEELPEIATRVAGLEPAATLAELTIALRRVQALEPAGVAARSVAECLHLQLDSIDCPDMKGQARQIIDSHLQALAGRDVTGLAKALQQTPARIEAVCDRIRRLDPRPGWRFSTSRIAYVVPDVIVRKVRGQWQVQLNPAVVPRVRLNQVYAQLFARHRRAQDSAMGEHLSEARWTLRNVEQRFSTILDVAKAIIKRQKNFLDYGPMAMKPLGLKEIADEVGVHESTVSRVTNNKYMATPTGVFELKYFFSRAMISANGSACSGTAIRGLIKDIIDAESPDSPLSDAEITRQLAAQGLLAARRTVTKYRQMLKIEAVERRRRHPA